MFQAEGACLNLFPPPYRRGSTHMSSAGVESMISWNSHHSSLLPIPENSDSQIAIQSTTAWCVAEHPTPDSRSSPMLTFLVSWQTCTSIFLLSRLALFLRFSECIASNSECGRKPSLMGVTVAEGTDEVGVLDLLPVLLGVAATESDSDPSSFTRRHMGAGDKGSILEICSWETFLLK